MDIKEIFTDLRERVSNPVLLSFVASWCVWNYPIVIGLIFYNQQELAKDGYISYIHLVQSCLDPWRSLWYPIICAFGYAFAFPIIRLVVKSFTAKLNDWTAILINELTENSPYTKKEFTLKIKEKDQEIAEMTALSINNKATQFKNNELEAQNATLTKEISDGKTKHELAIVKLNEDNDKIISDLKAASDKRNIQTIKSHDQRVATLEAEHLRSKKVLLETIDDMRAERSNDVEQLQKNITDLNDTILQMRTDAQMNLTSANSELLTLRDTVKEMDKEKQQYGDLLNNLKGYFHGFTHNHKAQLMEAFDRALNKGDTSIETRALANKAMEIINDIEQAPSLDPENYKRLDQ